MTPEIQIKGKSDAWDMSDLHPGLRWQFSVMPITHSNGLSCGYLQVDRVLNCRFIFIKSRKFT